jgi:O-antigen ligase
MSARPSRAASNSFGSVFDVLVACLVLVYVWRIQDMFPVLSAAQFPILSSLAALAVFLLQGHVKVGVSRLRTPIIAVAAFILVWMVVSVPGSVYQGLSFGFILNDHIKTFLMMLMIAASIRGFVDVQRLILINLLGAGIYCFMILTTFQVGPGGRLGDLFYYDANDLAMMVAATLPFAVYFLGAGTRPWHRLLALACSGVFVLAIVRTGSRGGFLALIGVGAYLLFFFAAIPMRTRVGFLAGGVALLMAIAGPQYWTSMATLLNPKADYNWSENNEVGRMAIWKRGMGYMAANPIAGVGVNAFPVAEGTLSDLASRQELGIGLKWSAAHNSFVQIGAELGVPGLIAFALMLWRMFGAAWRIARRKLHPGGGRGPINALGHAMVASLIGYAIGGFFLSQAYSALLYSLCGILAGLVIVTGGPPATPAGAPVPVPTGHRRSVPRRQRPLP